MADAFDHRVSGTSFGITTPGSPTNASLNGSGIGMAWCVQAESADPITHVWFRYGSRTGTPPTYSIRIELLDAAGDPNNIDAGGGSPTAATFTPPADTTWNGLGQWIQLANPWTPTLGQVFYITIRYSSGTVDASNFSSFTLRINDVNASIRNIPFSTALAAGVWTKSSLSFLVAWKTASRTFGYPTIGGIATTVSTVGHRVAAAVTIPVTWGTTYKVKSFESLYDPGTAAGTVKFAIWDSAGTEIASVTMDTDAMATQVNRTVVAVLTTQTSMLCGTEYYFGVEVSSGSVSLNGLQLGAAADRSAFPNGLNKSFATWDGAAWTKDTTIYPLIDITASDITVPSGGGAGPIVIGNGGAVIRGLTI